MSPQEHSNIEHFTEGDPLEPNGERKDDDKSRRSCYKTIKHVTENVTVEPTMLLFVLSCIISMLATQNLGLEKACRVNLNFTDEICKSLKLQEVGNQNEYEKQSQQLIAKFMSYKTYITATVPCIISLFAGSYSDRSGRRKIFLIIPIVGQMLVCTNNILNVYFFHELNLEILTFSEAVFEGFSGGWALPFLIMFAFVSSVTNEKDRTFRMGLLNFALTVGFPIGMLLSGILLKKAGYFGAYGVSLGFHFFNLMYNVFILKDPPKTPGQKMANKKKGVLANFFSLKNVVETFRVVFENGPNNRRLRMMTYMIVIAILFGPMYGEISVMYLSTRYRFNWDEVQFSLFQSYNFITHTIGTIFSITVFSKILGWHDSILGIISTVSKIAASFIYCFATTGKIFIIAPMVEILNGTAMLAMRSLTSKLVDQSEFGKVSSIISLTENLMPLLYVPLYTTVYKATMEQLPGAVFLVGAAMTFPATVVFSYLLYEHRKGVRRIKRQKADDLPPKQTLVDPN